MKPALHTVSYAGVWPGQARLELDEIIPRAADLGYAGLMLMAKRPHASVLDMTLKRREQVRALLERHRVGVACLAGYNDFTMGAGRLDIPVREMQIHFITELARLAADLSAPAVRVFTGFSRSEVPFQTQWNWVVDALRECAKRAAEHDVIIGVQNHHDIASHWQLMRDLIDEVNEPNCRAMFDAWTPALHGDDLAEAVKGMGQRIVHTTVADYVRRPRFDYLPELVNFARRDDAVRMVPPGEGFIDYAAFFGALAQVGYDGYVGCEICAPLRGGGHLENLDACAKKFISFLAHHTGQTRPATPLGKPGG